MGAVTIRSFNNELTRIAEEREAWMSTDARAVLG